LIGFDPANTLNDGPIVLIDGECVLCNRLARFVIRRDPHAKIRFAALGSPAAARVLAGWNLPTPPPGTFVLVAGGHAFLRSEAAIRLFSELPFPWHYAGICRVVPLALRDAVYSLVAAVRYRVMGRVPSCGLLDAAERERFLRDESPEVG
jgi:predicted DCC family thiol-disulfide oxidoreductase YuxK